MAVVNLPGKIEPNRRVEFGLIRGFLLGAHEVLDRGRFLNHCFLFTQTMTRSATSVSTEFITTQRKMIIHKSVKFLL